MLCSEGYGLLLESSVTFLMLCWTQTFCWSSSFSLRARSSSSAFNSMSLSAISLVLQPGPTPLKHKQENILMSREYLFETITDKATQIHLHSIFPQVLRHLLPDLKKNYQDKCKGFFFFFFKQSLVLKLNQYVPIIL